MHSNIMRLKIINTPILTRQLFHTLSFHPIPFDYPPFYVHFKRKFNNLPFANLMFKTALSSLFFCYFSRLLMLFLLIICAFSMSIIMRLVCGASQWKRRGGSVSFISITKFRHSHISICLCMCFILLLLWCCFHMIIIILS